MSSKTLMVRGGVVAGALGAALIGLGSPAFAAIPQVSVTPHKNLLDNQKVTVSLAHFPANKTVTIVQCNENGDGDLANCNVAGEKKAKTNGKGGLSGVKFTVKTGQIGSGSCGTGPDDKSCTIAAISSTGQMQQTNISFKLFS